MDMFMTQLKQTALSHDNVAFTENGAQMYGSTGSALLDLNFSVSNLRSASEEKILEQFLAAYHENQTYALKWLFYARDIRGGLGERRLFRVVFNYFAKNDCERFEHLVDLIPEYGRWDDLIGLLNTPLEKVALRVIRHQFTADVEDCNQGKSVSLLAKWMPSINSKKKENVQLANKIRMYMGMGTSQYRKTLSKLRKHIDVVEVKMSHRAWGDIIYPHVPGRANMLYSKAFMRHDPERRQKFLDDVLLGKTKVNASTIFPHEIVHRIRDGYNEETRKSEQAMWQNLPPFPDNGKRTIVVSDGSGSMRSYANSKVSKVECLDVAMGIAIYFSQFLSGPYRDKVITFSEHPRFIDLAGCNTIHDKVNKMLHYTEVANTNIEAVFDMILETAIRNHLIQSDLPDNILVISDMEFDRCVESHHCSYGRLNRNLFDVVASKYKAAGYSIPRVCFWNVRGKSGAIPMIQNDLGCALISGYSIHNAKLVMSGVLDPLEALIEVLNSERYSPIVPTVY